MTSTAAPTSGLVCDPALQSFLVDEVLPGTGIDPDRFLDGLARAVERFAPRNRQLLARREELQSRLDRWYDEHGGPGDPVEYRAFLEEIGYLEPAPAPFTISTSGVDAEIASICGPQLVVPVTNARYALNAANARWGSLYDALYGTDALGDPAPAGPYDPQRGARVVAWVRSFLDDVVPLDGASHADATRYAVEAGRLVAWTGAGAPVGLAVPEQLAGHVGSAASPTAIVLVNHGLHLELRFDPDHPVGAADRAGIADVVVEAAVTTIVDFEDSVACVDAGDKVGAYRNWLGLVRGDLVARFEKGGRPAVRTLAPNRTYTAPGGEERVLRGRSLLLARVVGHLMSTPAVVDGESRPIPEGILDAFVIAAIAMHDRVRPDELRNSASGSVYLVKPKMHGPAEVAFACDVLAAVEATLDLPPRTLKIGIMDEERRTTLNLEACIREAADRVVFINTGFLDRTGDEIHTSMRAGPVVRKNDMRSTRWIRAYEDANVDIGLRCGFAGRAQIGKGMWAAPDRMAALLEEKIAHPRAGANCAWVPSPTAAVLHATHYHRVDVRAQQQRLAGTARSSVDDLLAVPVTDRSWTAEEIGQELDNNVQGILGYTVRWVDAGIGCSKVPDLQGVGLMEDRATCRISSQHVANWLRHGVVSAADVESSLRRMATVVDGQNAADPSYTPMAPGFDGPAFRAGRALIFEGERSPSGYTEPILHQHRLERKRQVDGSARP